MVCCWQHIDRDYHIGAVQPDMNKSFWRPNKNCFSLSPPVSIFIYIYIIERIKIGLDYWTGLDWITYIYIEIIHKIGLALDIHTHTLEGSGQPDSSQEERHGEFQQSPLPPLASRFAAARSVASSAARAGRAGT